MLLFNPSFIAFFVFAFWLNLNAQESVNSGGGDASGSNGSVAFTVGQVVYTTSISSSGAVAHGVQQPFEIFSLSSVNHVAVSGILVFPNPTDNFLTLIFEGTEELTSKVVLSDLQGRILQQLSITSHQTRIELADFPPAVYFLNVYSADDFLFKTFQIIKNP